ncbi:MAG: nickel pincer cofactor biosynthesis protein LarB [Candidatus Omnitrophica bacterium]|nr:nickel pincer cofactor biosynthesis protein LarB [Candidatus Omnitrophota bacterium]
MESQLKKLLLQHRTGRLKTPKLIRHLRELPYRDLKFAKVDLHRSLRRNFPEVIYAKGKTAAQVVAVAEALREAGNPVLVTKVPGETADGIQKRAPWLTYFPGAQLLAGPAGFLKPKKRSGKNGICLVVTAGTSDIPVAEEAVVTLQLMGCGVKRLFDVGVAGLHRILDKRRLLRQAKAIIVVAGMDGALPSVVSGLVAAPVIAVPTSVGYGASFEGVAPLLTMLNGCSPGVGVVNIDNGFGAGYLAAQILRSAP